MFSANIKSFFTLKVIILITISFIKKYFIENDTLWPDTYYIQVYCLYITIIL